MSWIETITYEDANTKLKALYDKPIGMGETEISGVGTIAIHIPGGTVGDTRAKCQRLQ